MRKNYAKSILLCPFHVVSYSFSYHLFKNFRSLWYIAHGFTLTTKPKGQCFVQYNTKGVETNHKISPITLKQLFVPFTILICGWILGVFLFLREKMHEYFRRQMIDEEETAHPVTAATPPATESPITINEIEMEPEAPLETPSR